MPTSKSLRDWLVELGFTSAELAQRAGLDVKVVESIVAGRYTTSPAQRAQIAAALSVAAAEIRWGNAVGVDHMYGHGPQFGRSPQAADGTSNTFMISENVQAGTYDESTTGRVAFGISVLLEEDTLAPLHVSTTLQGECYPYNICPLGKRGDDGPANLVLLPEFSVYDQQNDHNARINADLGGEIGQHPRPSSFHPAGVNMLWCDGRVTFVNRAIDDFVYARLLSPGGSRYGQVIDGNID